MRKYHIIFLSMAIIIGLISSCQVTVTETANYDVSGNVVNAEVATTSSYYYGMSSTRVKLTRYEDGVLRSYSTYTTYLSSGGSYTFNGVENGTYKLTGELSGYTFVPMYVDITGSNTILPDLIGYQTPSNSTDILIFLQWDNTDYDLDLKLSAPSGASSRTVVESSSPSQTSGSANLSLKRDVKAPYDLTGSKEGYNGTSSSEPRVETIRISGTPYYNSSAGDVNGVPQDEVRIYIDSYGRLKSDGTFDTNNQYITGLTDNSIPAADARLFIMQGSTLYGTWEVPFDTAETTLHVASIKYAAGQVLIYSAGNISSVNADENKNAVYGINKGVRIEDESSIVIIQR
ncbi:beta-sandwich domain-containing protein [Spirochaeta cellobiosiphila]|uniref:beta-sandwich domain-containing protein n=1 Tax=Spirochaeta cellobiosiphila TaxID=504483 RepID=UPI0004216B6B|nr:DUF2012 domain-containing protein [Spirochaeta cellobiosiphila]